MSSSTKSKGIVRALQQLLPAATLSLIHERPWHSLTFSGVQVCISLVLPGVRHADIAARFADELPEYEFNLRGQLVADIAVLETVVSESQRRLMIDALLLDD